MLKRFFMWKTEKTPVEKISEKSLFLGAFICLAEDALLWKNNCVSIASIILINLVFFVSVYINMRFLHFIASISLYFICMDALEAWLKYKHRTTCLKRLPNSDGMELYQIIVKICLWMKRKVYEFLSLREANPSKSFLLCNILLGAILIVGRCISGAVFLYFITLSVMITKPISPHIVKIMKKVQHHADSDEEVEGLLPEISEQNIMELSFEAAPSTKTHTRHSTESWLPEDLGDENLSDSSDNSNSISSNLLIEKTHVLEKEIESSSDSSEEDYLPVSVGEGTLRAMNLELTPRAPTATPGPASAPASWSSSAMSTLWGLGDALSNTLAYTTQPKRTKYKQLPSDDSTDGFEIIDAKDVM